MKNDTFEGPFSLIQMFWGNIAARPLRGALSVIAIAIQVILVLMIVGLTSGIVSEWGQTRGGSRRRHHGAAAELIDFSGVCERGDAGVAWSKDRGAAASG